MGFDNFGTVSFTTEGKAVDFTTYLEQGKVMTTRCPQCEASYFPPKMDCPKCLSSDVEWFEIKGSGKLATYTIVNYGPTGFEDDAPYRLAIADLTVSLKRSKDWAALCSPLRKRMDMVLVSTSRSPTTSM